MSPVIGIKDRKWLSLILPYLAVWVGLFLLKNAWIALIGFHAAILLAIMFVQPNLPIKTLFRSKSPRCILISVLVSISSGIGLYFFWDVFGSLPNLPAQLQSIGLTSSAWPAFIAYFSLVNPWVEEFFWRGVLVSPSKKLLAMDVVFAGYHAMALWGRVYPGSILFAVIILTSAGWIWRQISREDGGLLAAVLGHMVADFSILLAIYWKCN